MLDVHPPHESIHSWRSFFIHIATIVIGLLIAVALEQVVERVHNHYELIKIREELAGEMEENRKALSEDEHQWFLTAARLKNDLEVLDFIRRHPGIKQTELPGDLQWDQRPFMWNHAVWDAAITKGVVRLMPPVEANHSQEFYELMTVMRAQSLNDWDAINAARQFDLLDTDPTHLLPGEVIAVLQLTEAALAKHIQFGQSFGRYASEFPELPHSITWQVVDKLRSSSAATDNSGMSILHQQTVDNVINAAAQMLKSREAPSDER